MDWRVGSLTIHSARTGFSWQLKGYVLYDRDEVYCLLRGWLASREHLKAAQNQFSSSFAKKRVVKRHLGLEFFHVVCGGKVCQCNSRSGEAQGAGTWKFKMNWNKRKYLILEFLRGVVNSVYIMFDNRSFRPGIVGLHFPFFPFFSLFHFIVIE